MSRLDDLIDLIQSANEIYLINPTRNVRSAFIQIDDICELAMKSWLQIDTQSRQKSCTEKLNKLGILSSNKHKKSFKYFLARNKEQSDLEKDLGIISQNQKKQDLKTQLFNHGYKDGFLEDWISQEENGQYKNFNTVIEEIKQREANHTKLHKILG